jgi:hypothetical protein
LRAVANQPFPQLQRTLQMRQQREQGSPVVFVKRTGGRLAVKSDRRGIAKAEQAADHIAATCLACEVGVELTAREHRIRHDLFAEQHTMGGWNAAGSKRGRGIRAVRVQPVIPGRIGVFRRIGGHQHIAPHADAIGQCERGTLCVHQLAQAGAKIEPARAFVKRSTVDQVDGFREFVAAHRGLR